MIRDWRPVLGIQSYTGGNIFLSMSADIQIPVTMVLEIANPGMPPISALADKKDCRDSKGFSRDGCVISLIDTDPPMIPNAG
jgi:hypothetical protein